MKIVFMVLYALWLLWMVWLAYPRIESGWHIIGMGVTAAIASAISIGMYKLMWILDDKLGELAHRNAANAPDPEPETEPDHEVPEGFNEH